MTNSRLKLFLENFLFYGGLTMLTKAFPLIMLPVVTRLLPDPTSYGIADMFNVISNFGTQIAMVGMYDAMFREFFEDNNKIYQKKVTSTAFFLVLIISIFIMCIAFIFRGKFSKLFFNAKEYSNLITICGFFILISALRTIMQAPTRMRNKRKVFFFTGIGTPVVSYGLILVFIRLGFTYKALIYANVLGVLVFLLIFSVLNKKDFNIKYFDKKVLKELLKIGIPLVPTFIIYWVFSSMDRIMISKMLNNSELGVYSVGSRLASVSLLIYTAFAGGWQYFAFSTMKDKDQIELNSNIFEYLGIISFVGLIITLPFISPVFNLLFEGDYIRGKEVFPFLFLSPLLLMLFQTLASQFIVIKKSYLTSLSLGIGGFSNIFLNYFFINNFGIKGAAFATLISYLISIFIVIIIAKHYRIEKIKKRFYIISLFALIIIIFKFYEQPICYYFISIITIILSIVFYKSDLKKIINYNKKYDF